MAEIYQLPEGGSNSGTTLPFSIPIGMGNGLFGNGNNTIGDLIGLAIVASIFGWNNGNGFGGFGNNMGSAGFISNQLNNDSGRELIMNAITSQGEASRSAIQNLATTLGQDYNTVFGAVQNVQSALATLAAQQGMSTLQIVNAIQSGDAALTSQFCQCCCQTQQQIMAQGYENQIRTIEQTNTLQGQADRNAAAITAAIANQTTMINEKFCDLEKREMQSKIDTQSDIIGQLRGQIDNANQTAAITGYVNSIVTPLANKVNEIAAKQLPTVNVQWPQLTAVNTTPYVNGGFYNNGYNYYGNGWGGNIVF